MREFEKLLSRIGVTIPKDARILDFGCGAGGTVYALLDRGYTQVYGYDIQDYLKLREPGDREKRFRIGARQELRLPFDDATFDLIISDQVFEHVMDQVAIWKELHRVTRPGGQGLHNIPACYMPIEGHMFVPLGSMLGHRWWYKLWAVLGIRNGYQKGLSADETADRNALYFVERLRYVPTSCYRILWKTVGFDYRFLTQEYFDGHRRGVLRVAGRLNRAVPILGWLYRLLQARQIYLRKPEGETRP